MLSGLCEINLFMANYVTSFYVYTLLYIYIYKSVNVSFLNIFVILILPLISKL